MYPKAIRGAANTQFSARLSPKRTVFHLDGARTTPFSHPTTIVMPSPSRNGRVETNAAPLRRSEIPHALPREPRTPV